MLTLTASSLVVATPISSHFNLNTVTKVDVSNRARLYRLIVRMNINLNHYDAIRFIKVAVERMFSSVILQIIPYFSLHYSFIVDAVVTSTTYNC